MTYSKYGKQWREGLFYTHFLGLPMFLLFAPNIIHHWDMYNRSMEVNVGAQMGFLDSGWGEFGELVYRASGLFGWMFSWMNFEMPRLWLYLALNVGTQYICVSGVHKLSSIATAVTLNLILSIRKVVSLMLSVLIFQNPFNIGHWFGALLVFVGTVVYSLPVKKAKNVTKEEPEEGLIEKPSSESNKIS
ncbi:hypothetical protein HK098_006051 [Nowakowskiella sp. JEL0407]|nr:hypothetical protein HK098_006051 [Nowakowskiella sp. JEL0407]